MKSFARTVLALVLVGASPALLCAEGLVRLPRMPDISPDGKTVVFSYLGDIWSVEAGGGAARPVTIHQAHDILPAFSPDGKHLAFSSTRHGGYDVFVIPARSGKPTRLTFDSAADMVCGWSPDGKYVLFSSDRDPDYPQGVGLYRVPVQGGRVERALPGHAKEGAYSPDGKQLAWVHGPGSWYRQGYRGSANDEIWIGTPGDGASRRLTRFEGQDGAPMWSRDGRWLYYVSDQLGEYANVVRVPLTGSGARPGEAPVPQAVTRHREAVRRARMSHDGQWLVYECGDALWLTSTGEKAQPRKLAIEVYTDDRVNTERIETFTGGATEMALSHDEKHVVLAVHGELFLMPMKTGADAIRLTETRRNNHGAAWAPDGNSLVFLSDRDGHENIYRLDPDDAEHPRLTEAHRFRTTQLTRGKEAVLGVSFAPHGKLLAFIQGGKLWTMKPDGKDQRVLVDQGHVFDYDWSPDGRWIVLARRDGSFASELYIVPSTGPTAEDPIRNVTRYATFNGDVTWSASGGHLAFLSARGGQTENTLHVLPLRKPAAGGAERAASPGGRVEIDWDHIHLRARQVLPIPVQSAAISPDGKQVAFRAANDGTDLWLANADGSQLTRLTRGNQNPQQIRWSRRRAGSAYLPVLYYRDGKGGLHAARAASPTTTTAGSPPPSAPASLAFPYKVKMRIRAADEFLEMFDQSWRLLAESFYDRTFHGQSWEAVRDRYRPLVGHVAVKEDLYSLIYLMLGELNASHVGVGRPRPVPDEPTAHLGLLFDETHRGPGLRIREVLHRGPADLRGLRLAAGDHVLRIDGEPIEADTNVSRLLNGKVGQTVALQVAPRPDAPENSWRRVEVRGASPGSQPDGLGIRDLMYDRWVERNARRVHEQSQGKLGYIHIPSMDQNGLDRFVRALYSDNWDREGLVLDLRFNGGGFTHDRVLGYLRGKEHTVFRQRDGAEGLVLRATDRRWTRPLVLLINNRSYSDAEIMAHAFRTLGLGKLVGETTGGHVIGTTVVRLIDGSLLRIPRTGVFTARGVNMEKEGVAPDVAVEAHPEECARGEDAQLDRGVQVLREVVAKTRNGGSRVSAGQE